MSAIQGFLSHAHDDEDFCLRLIDYVAKRIPAADCDLYMSERAVFISTFIEDILTEIKNRSIFVVVLSAKSVASPWVRLETMFAVSRWVTEPEERVIIPVKREECDVDRLSLALSALDIVDCTGIENAGFEKLVQKFLKSMPAPALAQPTVVAKSAKTTSTPAQQPKAPKQHDTERQLLHALEQLDAIVQELTHTRGKAMFSAIGQRMTQQRIDYHALGLKVLIREAEVRGMIRVFRSVDSSYALPADYQPEGDVDVPITLTNPQMPAIPRIPPQAVTPEQLLPLIDFLEKSLPYVNRAGILGRAKKKLSALSSSVNALVDEWLRAGDLVAYNTEMCTNDSGVAAKIEGLRLNPGSASVSATLEAVYAANATSWRNLSLEKRSVLVVTYLLLAEENPTFYWHTLRSALVANDGETDWDWVFASAVDADVLHVDLFTSPHPRTGTNYTIKRITLNKDHPDVVLILRHGIDG